MTFGANGLLLLLLLLLLLIYCERQEEPAILTSSLIFCVRRMYVASQRRSQRPRSFGQRRGSRG